MITHSKKLWLSLVAQFIIVGCAVFAAFHHIMVFFILTLFAFLLLLVIMFQENRFFTFVALGILVIPMAICALLIDVKIMAQALIIIAAAGGYYWYHRSCVRLITNSDNQKKIAEREKEHVKDKYTVKDHSLQTLRTRVDEIFKLFEVAKEFNECLQINDIMTELTARIVYDIPFSRGTLILLEGGAKRPSIGKIYTFYEERWEEVEEEEWLHLEDLIAFLEADKHVLTIDEKTAASYDFIKGDIFLPLWGFPLCIGGKMIAVVILEGGRVEDFAKFSIIAGHLALQIKKISLYRTVKELSITDGLTGVFVRRHFLERFEEELRRSIKNNYQLCVLMLDIDHFKLYNDTFGHLVGDVTLREVAKIIKENVRRVDLIARYGGEEFAMVLPETNKQGGLDAAERIRVAAEQKCFRVYDEETRVTVSIGVASFPADLGKEIAEFYKDLPLELLQHADQALYRAKDQGRNRVATYK